MTSPETDKDKLRQLSDLFWQFHNDRLNDPSLTDMTPYLQPFLELVQQERRKAAIEELWKFRQDAHPENGGDNGAWFTKRYFDERFATLSQEGENNR